MMQDAIVINSISKYKNEYTSALTVRLVVIQVLSTIPLPCSHFVSVRTAPVATNKSEKL